VNASWSSVLNEGRRKRVFGAIDQIIAEIKVWGTSRQAECPQN